MVTKGEWRVVSYENGPYHFRIETGCNILAGVYSKTNANLIAAAPDMYEALEYAEAFCEAVGQGLVAVATRDMVEGVIKEALAKARGNKND